jgi:diguanylate cyclase (GGDEF)-like protein/PAS domain S-box-containing protein
MIGWLRARIRWLERTGLALALVLLALALGQTGWLNRWDLLFYDWSLSAGSRAPAEDIVIVAIDEQSLRDMGRWPWSRHVHAELVRKLAAAGAKAVALDIIFAEPDRDDPTADQELAAALAEHGRVVLPVLNEQIRTQGQLIETLPVPALAQAAARLGHVDVDLDQDGIARGVYLKAGLGSPHWSTLSLALLEAVDPGGWQTLPGRRAPPARPLSFNAWQRDYHILIPFAGPPGHFQQASYQDVLDDHFTPDLFHDRWVLVGVTAAGLGDALPTPVSARAQPMPGVEFNANILDALLQGVAIQPLPSSRFLPLTALLVLLPLMMYAVCPPGWMLPLAGLMLALTLVVSFGLLWIAQLWFPPATALLVQGLGCALWIGQRWRQARHALLVEQERAQATLYSVGDAVVVTDPQGRVESLNPVAESLLGCTQATVQGQPLGAIFRLANDPDHRSRLDLAALCLRKNQFLQLPEPGILVSRDGQEYAVRASAAPIRDPRGRALGAVVAFGDLTENRRLTQQVTYQATHDALTQLPNRHLLQDRLKRAIARARRAGQNFAVLCVDLDHFKKVNDGLGHAAGDTLLRAAATRLLACGRGEDTIARLDGDTFVILLENLHREDHVVGFAQKILEALAPSFHIESHECFITASVGVSLYPKDGQNMEMLLKNADSAMHRAKDNGRDTIQFYSQDMHVRALERLTLEQSLRYALERNELELHYQPQMDLLHGRIIGVEALLRWRHAQRGLIPPKEFVPLAEETGLIEVLGEWVLRTACRQASAWQKEGLPPLRMAVNLSPRQFLRPGLVEMVGRILEEAELEPRYLDLEITEGLLMKNVEGSIVTLHALKRIGVHLSIDDFGTGYSSLSYLKRFPIDQLKIDRSFVSDIIGNQDNTAIALAVIAMAHSMRLKVIAEGVENPAQLAFLQQHRCDEMQGYYLSRPAPARQISALLRGESSSAALQDPNSRRSVG